MIEIILALVVAVIMLAFLPPIFPLLFFGVVLSVIAQGSGS